MTDEVVVVDWSPLLVSWVALVISAQASLLALGCKTCHMGHTSPSLCPGKAWLLMINETFATTLQLLNLFFLGNRRGCSLLESLATNHETKKETKTTNRITQKLLTID